MRRPPFVVEPVLVEAVRRLERVVDGAALLDLGEELRELLGPYVSVRYFTKLQDWP